MELLPNETLVHIFDYVIHADKITDKFAAICRLMAVCRMFHDATRAHPIMNIINLVENQRNADAFKIMLIYSRMRVLNDARGTIHACIQNILSMKGTEFSYLLDSSHGFRSPYTKIIKNIAVSTITPIRVNTAHNWRIDIHVNGALEVSSLIMFNNVPYYSTLKDTSQDRVNEVRLLGIYHYNNIIQDVLIGIFKLSRTLTHEVNNALKK